MAEVKDVAIVGAGMAGMATAARLQARGLSTIVFEAHGQPGGCAGFFYRKGFSFDVGATTLVDFEAGGVGGEFLNSIGLAAIAGEQLPGYRAWLPDRIVNLYRNPNQWVEERLQKLGYSEAHRRLWKLLDRLASVFWKASREGIKLPVQSVSDLLRAVQAVEARHLLLGRYLCWTMGDALRAYGLRDEKPLVGLLSMLIEDTIHSTVDQAPLINAALGITIRGAGLTRPHGGMRGFWKQLVAHYRALGGVLKVGCPVEHISGRQGKFRIETRRGTFQAAQVVSAIPAALSARLAPSIVSEALLPYVQRDASAQGGAIVVFLGVPEREVANQTFTHHQFLQDYNTPLGNGNNMFISVSAPDDSDSAPPGFRAVMISTHCDLAAWEGLTPEEYSRQKCEIGERLVSLARRVYPNLGENPVVYEVGTPQTYARFTQRPRGAVGGVRQTLRNTNQSAVPHNIGVPGFWLAGDTTWPGLGTVACVLGSRIVAELALAYAKRLSPIPQSSGGLYHAPSLTGQLRNP